jgi:tol-pal system protein YbgF
MITTSSTIKRAVFCALILLLSFNNSLFDSMFNSTVKAVEVTRSLSLEDRVKLLEQQLASANRLRAEAQFEITQLKKEVRELRGQMEEQSYQLEQIITRQRELYRDIDARLGQVPPSSNSGLNAGTDSGTDTHASTTFGNANDSANNQQSANNPLTANPANSASTVPAGSQNGNATPATNVIAGDDGRLVYSKIFPLVRSKRYDEAVSQYQQFITNYPNSELVADARYWLAQIYVVQSKTDLAEVEYLAVAEQYPQHEKAPLAWLKLGQLYQRQGITDKASEAFDQVINLYPDTTAAQMASSALANLQADNP